MFCSSCSFLFLVFDENKVKEKLTETLFLFMYHQNVMKVQRMSRVKRVRDITLMLEKIADILLMFLLIYIPVTLILCPRVPLSITLSNY